MAPDIIVPGKVSACVHRARWQCIFMLLHVLTDLGILPAPWLTMVLAAADYILQGAAAVARGLAIRC